MEFPFSSERHSMHLSPKTNNDSDWLVVSIVFFSRRCSDCRQWNRAISDYAVCLQGSLTLRTDLIVALIHCHNYREIRRGLAWQGNQDVFSLKYYKKRTPSESCLHARLDGDQASEDDPFYHVFVSVNDRKYRMMPSPISIQSTITTKIPPPPPSVDVIAQHKQMNKRILFRFSKTKKKQQTFWTEFRIMYWWSEAFPSASILFAFFQYKKVFSFLLCRSRCLSAFFCFVSYIARMQLMSTKISNTILQSTVCWCCLLNMRYTFSAHKTTVNHPNHHHIKHTSSPKK